MYQNQQIVNRTHFDEIVAEYDETRSSYPLLLFKDLFAYIEKGSDKQALEIGAGTGIATNHFLLAGYQVTAVEIGEKMAEFLRNKFRGNDHLTVVNGSFEDAVLEKSSFDVIYAASAFHWVNSEIACPKVHALLKRGGAVALFRYHAQPRDGDALYDEIQGVYRSHFHQPYVQPMRSTAESLSKPTGILMSFGCRQLEGYGFGDVKTVFYDMTVVFSRKKYLLFLDTLSDHRSLKTMDRQALYTGIGKAIDKHGGYIKIDYIYHLYMGKKI